MAASFIEERKTFMKYSIIIIILGLVLLGNFPPAYAVEQNVVTCSDIDRVILIVDHANSLADVNVRVRPAKLFTVRFNGQNYENRASAVANDIKNCHSANFIKNEGSSFVSKVLITLLSR